MRGIAERAPKIPPHLQLPAVVTAGVVVILMTFLVGTSSRKVDAATVTQATSTTSASATSSEATPSATPTHRKKKHSTSDDADDDDSTPSATSTADSSGSGDTATSCIDLPGDGSFDDPFDLGDIESFTIVKGCAPLTSGHGFSTKYFSFTLTSDAGSDATAGVRFETTVSQQSMVNLRILHSSIKIRDYNQGIWISDGSSYTGRYQRIGNLRADTYIISADKIDSPLRSTTTPEYSVFVDPD